MSTPHGDPPTTDGHKPSHYRSPRSRAGAHDGLAPAGTGDGSASARDGFAGARDGSGGVGEGSAGVGAVMSTRTNAASRPTRQRFGPGAFMGGPAAKALNFKDSGKRMLRMLKPQRAIVTLLLGFGVASVTLSVLGPRVLGHATDLIVAGVVGAGLPSTVTRAQVIANARQRGDNRLADVLSTVDFTPGKGIDFAAVGRVLLLVLVIYAFSSLLMYLQGRLVTLVGQRTVYRLREQVEIKLSKLPLRYFDQQPRGEILSRVTNDIDNISQTVQQTMSQLLISLMTIVGVLAMMFWISPLLAVIALISVPVSVLVAARIGKKAQPQFIAQWSSTGQLNAHIEEMYTGHSLVKVFGRTQAATDVFEEHNAKLYAASFKAQFISGIIQPAMQFLGNINYVLIAVAGGLRVASGAISIGEVQAFIQYSRQFSQPITQVASMANLLQSGVASAERVFELLDAPEQAPDPEHPASPGQIRGEVEFRGVTFRYHEDTPLIEDVALKVRPGQTVAIVGPTGAGKTTLVNLVMRFYEVDAGKILLDGVDIATMSRDELRNAMGMVLQDTWLFGGTIADNIAYGAENPTREQIVEAAVATHVDHFVRTLPDGYDTVIDEEASNLSAGEKQLITIARAFLAKPVILILDEATSSVDTRTEVLIQRAMTSLRAGRTSFIIAHRLSTIRDADVILVMESGQIVEHGTHEHLLAQGGAYARLYAAQFAQAVAEVD